MNQPTTSNYQSNDRHDNQKIFTLQRAEDETTQLIIGARRTAIFDEQLSDGAKVLFCLLLDLAVSRSSCHGFGAVLISVTKLTEALTRCPRAIYGWKKQLLAKRYIWITKVPMPNFWPVDVYHITALTEPGEMSQMATKDGFWGNGARRQLPEKIGKGAREPGQKALGLRGIKGHRSDLDPDSSNLPDNAPESGTKVHPSVAYNATGSGTKVHRGAAQNDTGEPHESAAGSRTKVQRGAARNDTGQPHKGDHIIKPKVEVISSSEIGGGRTPLESSDQKAFKVWQESLAGVYPSRLEKMRQQFREQRKSATEAGRELLKRKIEALTVLIEGPQPELAQPKPAPAKPTAKARVEKPMSKDEILTGAKYALEIGKPELMNAAQRKAAKEAGLCK